MLVKNKYLKIFTKKVYENSFVVRFILYLRENIQKIKLN